MKEMFESYDRVERSIGDYKRFPVIITNNSGELDDNENKINKLALFDDLKSFLEQFLLK